MSYQPQGMHRAAHPELGKREPKKRRKHTLLAEYREDEYGKGIKYRRYLDTGNWWTGQRFGRDRPKTDFDLIDDRPSDAGGISRKKRISPLTKIAQRLPRKLPRLFESSAMPARQ